MRVLVKSPFVDETGIHKPGDIIDVKSFSADRMEIVSEGETKKKVIENADAKPVKKTTRKKV